MVTAVLLVNVWAREVGLATTITLIDNGIIGDSLKMIIGSCP